MNTAFLLFAQYEKSLIPLEDIAEDYFGLTKAESYRLVNEGRFPIPAIRLRESKRAPYLIHIADLADYLDKIRKQEKSARSGR
jgi:hypothetical protein